MRRALLATALAVLAVAPAAHASDHIMRINEVMLSTGGDSGKQFVELLDPAAEPFPNSPYKLIVYDTNGTSVGQQPINSALLAGNASPVLIATAAADPGNTRDLTLTVALPSVGQACFTGGASDGKIHCVRWGCVASPLTAVWETSAVPVPPDGQSVQRQGSNVYHLAAPTPKAANIAGTSAAACPPPPDADGDGVPDSSDQCPNTPAQTANGCPPPAGDQDGDGIPDTQDACPTQPAPNTLNGCPAQPPPDFDADGVPDSADSCPDKPAQTANGCPPLPEDSDADGVPNASDACPTIPASTANGCPVGEEPQATAGDDTISGDSIANTICGLAGDDTISGDAGNDILWGDLCDRPGAAAGGNDTLNGNDGNDRLYGSGGNDRLRGGRGKDRLDGGKGNDRLVGGPGKNAYLAGAGNDTVNARNGKKETVDCGRGKKDRATVDQADPTRGCEKVQRP